MNDAATNLVIQQRGLKPATKIVLWFLCDRHNPDFGCFPTQARLAEDAEMSISALNEHLATLEELGLIHRIRTQSPPTYRRQPTRYTLGFEAGFPQEPPPKSIDGFVGITKEHHYPSPDFRAFHLRIFPKAVSGFLEEDAQALDLDFDRFFAELLIALGLTANGTLPDWWQGWPAMTHVRRWIDALGLSKDRIIETAIETRRDHPAHPMGPRRWTARWKGPPGTMRRPKQTPRSPSVGNDSQTVQLQRLAPAPKKWRPSTLTSSIRTATCPPTRSATLCATRCCLVASSLQNG